MMNRETLADSCLRLRGANPLVLNITNYVAMNFAANSLLAIGASPLMSFYPAEMEELVDACDAVAINIGCLDDTQIEAMRTAAREAHRTGKPWVLDPAGVGASRIRDRICRELIENFHPDVIRGNASEILFLNGSESRSRGVDSLSTVEEAKDAAVELAGKSLSVVSMSGETDVITDGRRLETVTYGSPLMPKVTAMGCTATAVTGAFLAVGGDKFTQALCAMALMGICGEKAAAKAAGTGSMQMCFIDALSGFTDEPER